MADKKLRNKVEQLTSEQQKLFKAFAQIVFEEKLRTEFLDILKNGSTPNQEERLLSSIKGNMSKRDYKQVKKLLKKNNQHKESSTDEHMQEMKSPVTEKEIHDFAKRLSEYVHSPSFFHEEVPRPDKIRFYLFGSLVTGYSSKKSRGFTNTEYIERGKPVDEDRVSDIDLGIIIGKELFESFIHSQFHSIKGVRCSFPISEQSSSPELGPFRRFFKEMHGIKLAKRTDRPLNIIFIEKSFFLKFYLKNAPFLPIYKTWVGKEKVL